MTSATILTLLVIPAAFLIWKTIALKLPKQKITHTARKAIANNNIIT